MTAGVICCCAIPAAFLFRKQFSGARIKNSAKPISFQAYLAFSREQLIVVTSSDAPKDRERVRELGANRYFLKPVDLDEFMKIGVVVKEVIGMQDCRSEGDSLG